MTAITPTFAELRGDFALRNLTRGETVFTPVFDATTAELTPNVTTEKVKGTGNKRGTIFTYETDRSLTLAITGKSRHAYMLEQALLGDSLERAASTVPIPFTFPAMRAGQLITLVARNVLTVVIPGKVEGVDFEVLPKSGVIRALNANITDIEGCEFTNGVFTELGVFCADAQRFEILFASEDTGQSHLLYNGLLVPSGAISLVSESGIGEVPVSFELSQVATAVADARLGKYGRCFIVN